MVTLNTLSYAKIGDYPVMPVHPLTAKKDTRAFKERRICGLLYF